MEFDNVLEKIKRSIKDGAAVSMEKIEEYTKIGKLKLEEYSVNKKIERNFIDMGERVYELIGDNKSEEIKSDILIKNAVEDIETLKKELDSILQKLEEAKSDYEDEEITGI